ncbi:MAG: chemotaxis protein CheR [Bacteroidetes bacterium HGW-Bacteroidetes-4]|jgi:chemotaxis protein methyltransferase CheR|nr:MAG: chemotaxis protein CheR [Bacteroidetes bacterium HGW-Bacteroidetes-4]
MVTNEDVQRFITAIKMASTYDFNDYSDRSFKRRVEKLLVDNHMDINQLSLKVAKDKDFLEKVVKDITVNTTELFRDPEMWSTLRYQILPKLKKNKSIFIWHAGCSSGQEIYSMLILLNELGMFEQAKVFASDINSDMLEVAKKGTYKYRFNLGYLDNFDKVIKENPLNYEDVKHVDYEKYFDIDKVKDTITMKQFLREKAVFRKHDLVKDGNIFYSKFDIIFCRNVIIYFNNKLQNSVIELFSNSLYREGYLILGAHESILGPVANNFERTKGFYRKKQF